MAGNCSETCETQFALGGKGTCVALANSSGFVCECPEGFSGTDDWKQYDDCRVNETLQFWVWVFTASACMLLVISAVIGMGHLLVYWDYVRSPVRRLSHFSSSASQKRLRRKTKSSKASKESSTSASGALESLSPRQRGRAMIQAQRTRVRQRYTIFSLYLFVSYAASALMYYMPHFFGHFRFEGHFYQDLGIALAASSVFVALWAFFYVWYIQLPSLRLYAKLFDVNTILVRRPGLVRNSIYLRVVIINIVNFFLMFAVYHIFGYNDSIELRDKLDTAFLYWCTFLLFDFGVSALMLSSVLYSLFNQLRSLSKEAAKRGISTGTELKTFDRAMSTIIIMRRAVMIIAPVAFCTFFACATLPAVRSRTYLAINFGVFAGNVAGMIVLFLYVRRLKGDRPTRNDSAMESAETGQVAPAYASSAAADPTASFFGNKNQELDDEETVDESRGDAGTSL